MQCSLAVTAHPVTHESNAVRTAQLSSSLLNALRASTPTRSFQLTAHDRRCRRLAIALFLAVGIPVLLTACASNPVGPIHLEEQIDHPWSQSPERKFSAEQTRQPFTKVDRVFVQCSVVQGNGYNWAATLGWLSSQVDLVAERATTFALANPGATVAIDLACMTGSSSGGAATSLFDHLLANPRLVGTPPGSERQLLSVAQARDLSAALMFLALSADFRGEMLSLALSAVGAYTGQLDRESQGEPAAYWRARSTPLRNQAIFGHWIKAAYLYDPSWFTELVGEDPLSIPTFAKRPMQLDAASKEAAEQRWRALSERARKILDQRTDSQSFDLQPLGSGMCVTSLAVPLEGRELPFELDDLILVAGCNAATFDQLIGEPYLRALLKLASSAQTRTRLRIASAGSWQSLLNITVREPDLITPLSGQLLKAPIALEAVATLQGNRLALIEPASGYLMLGGFAGPRLQAWPATALLLGRLASFEKQGVVAEGRIALFGLTDDRSNPTASFAQRTITNYFSNQTQDNPKGPSSTEALATFYDWQDEYCSATTTLFGPVQVDHFRMNWNLPGGPAAMQKRSRDLAALGYNLTKVQLSPAAYPDLNTDWREHFLFAGADEERYVPSPLRGGVSCQPETEPARR